MPWTEARKEIRRAATKIANQRQKWDHADSCPFLISDGQYNCDCNCMAFPEEEMLKEARANGIKLVE